ncbi:MAG: ArsR/SmtB family transcription factor [Candidatus Kariarchaeaceae archaeon]|jgi:DNA-binding transcriptional ArsR family regulator
MDKLLWYLIAGTRGGINRARIIFALNDRPSNANQISEMLNLDYKTVSHHLKVLISNRIITIEGDGYGKVHFLTEMLKREFDVFLSIWEQIKKEDL